MCLNKKIPQMSLHLVCMKPTIFFCFLRNKEKTEIKMLKMTRRTKNKIHLFVALHNFQPDLVSKHEHILSPV